MLHGILRVSKVTVKTTEALNEAEIEPEIRDVLQNSQQERMEQSIEIQEA